MLCVRCTTQILQTLEGWGEVGGGLWPLQVLPWFHYCLVAPQILQLYSKKNKLMDSFITVVRFSLVLINTTNRSSTKGVISS